MKSIIHTKLLAFVIYEQLLLSCLFFPPFKGDFLVDRFNSVAFAVSQVNNALDLIFLLIIFFGQFTTMIQVAKMVQYQILACPIHRLWTHPWQWRPPPVNEHWSFFILVSILLWKFRLCKTNTNSLTKTLSLGFHVFSWPTLNRKPQYEGGFIMELLVHMGTQQTSCFSF